MFVWVMGPNVKMRGCFCICSQHGRKARRPKSPHKWHAAHGYAFPVIGIMAEWLRRQTRNLVGSALVGSNPADVVKPFATFVRASIPWRSLHAGTHGQQASCVHSTRVVFIPSKDKIRVRVPMDAPWGIVVHGSIQPSQG